MSDDSDDPGEQGKREGIARAYEAADEAWKLAMGISVVEVAVKMKYFNTDDVEAYQRQHFSNVYTREKRAMGGIMQNARLAGVCIPIDETTPSLRPEAHKNPKRTWFSELYQGADKTQKPRRRRRYLDPRQYDLFKWRGK